MSLRRWAALAVALMLVIAACSSDSDSGDGSENAEGEIDASEVTDQETYNEYLQQASNIPLATSDAGVPEEVTAAAGGAPGFSRYVFRDTSDGVLPSLVEGPLGQQTRCQDPDLPCSYSELVELHESGDPIPDELNLTENELADLVDQLTTVNEVTERYRNVDNACADGFFSDRTQTANMGSHFTKMDHLLDGEVDPAKPDILLYGVEGDQEPAGQLGRCEGGAWAGEDLEFIGTSFIVLTGQDGDHPEGFAGDLDNWHIHYNLCRGAGSDDIVGPEKCEEEGGTYYPTLGWMIHAWVDPGHDNQLGVFSMWNPSIWPLSDPAAIQQSRTVVPDNASDGSFLPIANFQFEDLEAEVGDTVVFGNSDSVPHTVTAGTPDDPSDGFDSGVFAPGEQFTQTFESEGEYDYFCTLHPDMVGTVTVG